MSKYDERSDGTEYPYAFQQKFVLRYIKDSFSGKERASMLLTYNTISWIASDFSKSKKVVKNWPKTISTYSGIGKGTAQQCIRKLSEHKLIAYQQERNNNGRWNKRKIILPKANDLPDKVPRCSAESGEAKGGLTTTRETCTL